MEVIGGLIKAISEGWWKPKSYWSGLKREMRGEHLLNCVFLKEI